MRVRMSALRRCHVPSYNYEFGKGEEFDAVDEREAKRLERRRLAQRVAVPKPAEAAVPDKSPDSLFAASTRGDEASSDVDASGTPRKRRNYQRRDMQAEG
jgi:hypothetical protein